MTEEKLMITMPELITTLNNHIEIFECADALINLRDITQKLVEQNVHPSAEVMEHFDILVNAIDFIGAEARAFMKELKEKQTPIN
jgi:hypothetical protein